MVGIIILNYNGWKDVVNCIESIKKNTEVKYKIYIVDNCSKDDSKKQLMEIFNQEDIRLIFLEDNRGYSYGNNRGIDEAIKDGCEYLVVLNPDVELKNNAIDIMTKSLIDNEADFVGPEVINVDESINAFITRSWSYKWFIIEKTPFLMLYKFLFNRKPVATTMTKEKTIINGMLSGCCFAVKSDVFAKIGKFDENIFLYCEEAIIYEKIKNTNYKVLYNPTAKVFHLGSATIGGWDTPFSRRCYALSLLYIQQKYNNIHGIKLNFGKFMTKVDYRLLSKKYNQNDKEEYKILKEKMKNLK